MLAYCLCIMRSTIRIDKIATAKLLQAAFEANGAPQADVAFKLRLNQSQVSKILKGQFERPSRGLNALCEYFNIKPVMKKKAIAVSSYPELAEFLSEVLDGSRRRERAVIRLLKSARK